MTTGTLTAPAELLAPEDVDVIRARVQGRVIAPWDEGYDTARRIWNGMIDRHPAVIVRCRSDGDVVECVRFARERGLRVAVRGGGHNAGGFATCDGGLVIDLSEMRRVLVDPRARRARVQGGAVWADVDAATQPFGLATPAGEVSDTGVAGLTLNGGYGYLRRRYGLSCDNLVGADVVLADGTQVHTDAATRPELLWALRGGGGNFGVVTTFEFTLHPVGPDVEAITVAYPIEHGRRILREWRDRTAHASDALTTMVVMMGVPPAPEFPADIHGRTVCIIDGIHLGPPAEAEPLLHALRTLATPLFDLSGRRPYVEVNRTFDAFFPPGDRYYMKSLAMNALPDDALEVALDWVQHRPEPRDLVAIRHLGGAVGRVPADATAFAVRDAQYNLGVDAGWTDPALDAAHVSWARDYWRAMQPYSTGFYLNFPGFLEEGGGLIRAAYRGNYDRLVRIKQQYDPDNFFRLNQNIPPQ